MRSLAVDDRLPLMCWASRQLTMAAELPGYGSERAADMLRRDFTASCPNERWVADFTYVATWSGIVYVAFVVDVFSRAIVGWSAATSKRAKLVLDALDMAWVAPGPDRNSRWPWASSSCVGVRDFLPGYVRANVPSCQATSVSCSMSWRRFSSR